MHASTHHDPSRHHDSFGFNTLTPGMGARYRFATILRFAILLVTFARLRMSTLLLSEGPCWDDLRYLEAMQRLGSAAKAGRELGVATSTVYRRVAALERSLGVRCLVRGEGLTHVARELAELARRTGTTLIEIGRSAQQQHHAIAGSVTLSTVDGFAPLLTAPMAALTQSCPDLRVNLHISNKGLSLRKRQADIALSIADRPGPQLIGRRLFTVKYGVFGTPERAADGSQARWIVLGWPLQTTREARWERARVSTDAVAMATPSRRVFVDMVAGGLGLGLLPRRLAAMHPQLVEVEQYRAQAEELTRPAWLLTHPELRGSARVSVVMRTLAEHLQ